MRFYIYLVTILLIGTSCNTSTQKLKEENQRLKDEIGLFKSLENNRQKAVQHAQTRTFKVEDEREILSILFDTEDFDSEGRAVWTPNFAEQLNFPVSYDGFCYTKFEKVLLYNDEFRRAVVIFGTYEIMDNGEPNNGHVAAPMASIAYFTQRKENGWELTAFKKTFQYYGSWGEMGDIDLKQIGKQAFALDLSSGYSNMGETASYTSFYSIPDFEQLFNINTAYGFEGLGDESKAFSNETKIIIKPSSKPYYDIVAVTTGTKQSTKESDRIVSANSQRTFYFDETYGIYIQYNSILNEEQETD